MLPVRKLSLEDTSVLKSLLDMRMADCASEEEEEEACLAGEAGGCCNL